MSKQIQELDKKLWVSPSLLELGHRLFEEIEPRDSMYRVSSFLIGTLKDKPFEDNSIWISDAVLVLLLTWHNAFFRYGTPDNFHNNFKDFLRENESLLLKTTEITKDKARNIFEKLLNILSIRTGTKKKQIRKSGVGVAKTLHLLRPDFFPLVDNFIANTYFEKSNVDLSKFETYWKFKTLVDNQYEWMLKQFDTGEELKNKKTFYKWIDELNYVFFTQKQLNCERLVLLLKSRRDYLVKIEEEFESISDRNTNTDDNIYLEVINNLAK